MSVALRRAQSKPSAARPKNNQNQDHEEDKAHESSPVLSSTSTDIQSLESTPSRRAARNKADVKCGQSSEDEMEKALTIMIDNEHCCTRQRAKASLKRKRELGETESQPHGEADEEDEEEIHSEVEIDPELDRELENKSKQHNLTSANVRSIIHEVITNEHVVAMMKAAINETEPVPLFEPKMTRSKLKEVVEKGVVIPTWNISPIKNPSKVQGPQFVDIHLEEEEDSSDEEYCPDEEDEDETAEETLLESDLESTASSPRGTRLNLNRSFLEIDGENSCSPRQNLRRSSHVRAEVVPMGPPPPPQRPEPPRAQSECSFMEKLYAVDEELAIGTDRMNSYQSLTTNGEESVMAFRTRSKRPLRDVPLGRLEAELRAPDITPDMYEFGSAPEDREWTQWLQGLMNSDVENEEEGDDDDDPEYNFLADIDEPDVEDYRNDKAVRITKKEVNDLMEELFDAFQDELGGPDEEGHEDDEEKEEDDNLLPEAPNILETIPYQNPLADILNQSYRTVKEQLEAIRKRKAVLESKGVTIPPSRPNRPSSPTRLFLGPAQKLRLQQHIQQHVQLLTQVNMLSRSVDGLQTEACTSRQFLSELHFFAQCGEQTHPGTISIFRASNLQGALSLLEELDHSPDHDNLEPCPLFPGSEFSANLAWLMATRPVFLYPQLLPRVKLRHFSYKTIFTPAENCLVVLGHHHLKGTLNPLEMLCHYLLVGRNYKALRHHIQTAFHQRKPNILKRYFIEEKRPPMPLACGKVNPSDQRPPVERERHLMPRWLSTNLKMIYEEVKKYNLSLEGSSAFTCEALSDSSRPSYTFPLGTRYPPVLPDALAVALKPPPAGLRKKKNRSTKPSKPPPSPKVLEQALSRLPPILPKCADQTVEASQVKAVLKNPQSVAVPNVTNLANVKQGKLILTLPGTPLIPPRLGNIAVNNGGEGQTVRQVASASKIAPTNQGNIIMALPTAFICPAPIAKAVQTPPVAAPVSKEHMSQRCGTLLKLSLEQGPNSVASHNPKFLLLPTGCVVTKGASYKTGHLNTTGKCVAQEELPDVLQTVQHDIPQSGNLISYTERHHLQENSGSAEEEMEVHPTISNEEELEECLFREPFLTLSESSGSPTPSLAEEDDNVEDLMDRAVIHDQEIQRTSLMMPVLLNENGLPGWSEEQKEQKNTAAETEKSRNTVNVTAPASNISTQSVSMLQPSGAESPDWSWNPKHPTRLSDAEGEPHGHVSEEIPDAELHNIDSCDDDPRRDVKDVAFAQTYLEKVCEALQVVPGKVEEFLSVLYEFERSADDRTAVELFMRLKPVLSDWPELLRDFAAFLHPEQAQECGLAAEQQAFERSRRFLRQLEINFGEHSVHYRKMVRTLQHGLPKTLSGSEEMKAQIAMLFRDHTHLLEEYWVFFKQLHPGMRRLSDDEEEDDARSVSQMVQEDQSEQRENVRTSSSDKGVESQENQSCIQMIDATSLKPEQPSREAEMETDVSPDCNMQSYPKASQSPVCAKNISRMPSGEKVVLWTREADRVILTTCQERGASQSTFTSIAAQLGNKTADQVGTRYLDLIRLFHKSTKIHHTTWVDPEAQFSPEDEEPD